MAEDGEEKLIAVARQIAKSIGRTGRMTDDILQIFSAFDGRLNLEKLSDDHRAAAAGTSSATASGSGSGGDEEYTSQNNRHLHRNRLRSPPPSIERTFRSLDHRISRLLLLDRPIWSDSGDAAEFLDAFDELLSLLPDIDAAGYQDLPDLCDDLLQRCTLQLEDEFRQLLERPLDSGAGGSPTFDSDGDGEDNNDEEIPVAQPVPDYDIIIDALPPGTTGELHEIAKRMVAAGFGKECAHAYSVSRREFLEESVSRLGLRSRTAEDVQSASWADLEDEITRWTRAVAVAVRILFPSERRLCDRVFAGLRPVADLAFAESCRGTAIQLLGFADAVSFGSRAPERLFRVVDMFEALRDLVPELDSVFTDSYSTFLRSDAVAVCKGLAVAICGIFRELENLIRRDPPRAPVPGGGLHPITRYVMNYLRAACGSRRTLEEVMDEDSSGASAPTATDPDRPTSSLGVQIAWIMEMLQNNLESKAKKYDNPSLSCLFLINNGRYIIQKVKDSELGVLLGDDWIRREALRLRRWQESYQKGTWGKVLAVLRTDSTAAGAASAVRERLRLFNTYLEEIVHAQREWVVADEHLRRDMRVAGLRVVEDAYRSFLTRFKAVLEVGRGERLVRYRPEDLETKINELFQGG